VYYAKIRNGLITFKAGRVTHIKPPLGGVTIRDE